MPGSGLRGRPACPRNSAHLYLLAVTAMPSGLDPMSCRPCSNTRRLRLSSTPPVSGAIGHTASASSMHRPHTAKGSSEGPIVTQRAGPQRGDSRWSRVVVTSMPGRAPSSPNSAASISSPSCASAPGSGSPVSPPPVMNSMTNRRLGHAISAAGTLRDGAAGAMSSLLASGPADRPSGSASTAVVEREVA